MPLAGKKLTPLQVAQLAHRHGIPLGMPLVTAVAVCRGESAYYVGAWNFNEKTGDKSYGLWQINLIGNLLGPRLHEYGLIFPEQLFDPEVNARIMAKMSRGGRNWSPWGAYTNGSYKKYLPEAHAAAVLVKPSVDLTKYEPPPFPKGLRPDASIPSAKSLQAALKKAGYMSKWIPYSNNYGLSTQAAVIKFHLKHPLYASKYNDPAIGPKGWAALFREAYG